MTAKDKREHNGDRFDEWWQERSILEKVLAIIGFIALGVGLLFLCGLIVKALWNWLMPEIFGLKEITYWQAWGLFILCSILFKGNKFGGNDHDRTERRRKRKLRRYMREEMAGDDFPGSESSSETVQTEN